MKRVSVRRQCFAGYNMLFRIHNRMVRSELENRVKGMATCEDWDRWSNEPAQLQLTGNDCPEKEKQRARQAAPGWSV